MSWVSGLANSLTASTGYGEPSGLRRCSVKVAKELEEKSAPVPKCAAHLEPFQKGWQTPQSTDTVRSSHPAPQRLQDTFFPSHEEGTISEQVFYVRKREIYFLH